MVNVKIIASQFLDLWADEHMDNDNPDYDRLKTKLVVAVGGEA
jgi:hypothetical protein